METIKSITGRVISTKKHVNKTVGTAGGRLMEKGGVWFHLVSKSSLVLDCVSLGDFIYFSESQGFFFSPTKGG